mmetsp:Transcript_7018/g.23290  ORF Transcript_7018/g.23290 Transcript_7018/m.23290 type:complete len:137 (-) Transcript_7018:1781-2191(-)
MNAPERHLKFVVPDGARKVTFTRDTKISNAGTFVVLREDHTFGNLVRMQLHRDRHVLFAGYQLPHPLRHELNVTIQTDNDKYPPVKAMDEALAELKTEFDSIRANFQEKLQEFDSGAYDEYGGAYGGGYGGGGQFD